jgi:O-antigen/teichoic acid export membrane protein
MADIKRNAIGNLIGRVGGALLTLAALPIVIHLIGIESYGVIGFFASLQAVFGLLDLGLSMTMMREMARTGHDAAQARRTRDLVRTLEIVYCSVGLVIACISVAIAPLLATKWLNAQTLSTGALSESIALMGFALACQWPIALYDGGLSGLQRQVIVNVVTLSATITRTAASIAVLYFLSRSVQAYLLTQGIAFGLQTLVLRHILWKSVPAAAEAPRFRTAIVRELWKFAGSVNITTALGLVLTQADKLILSKIVPLSVFGYYALANTAASGLYYIIGPLFTAIYPQLAQNAAAGDERRLRELYHRGCQFIAVCVFPTGIVFAFFSRDVLLLWTQDPKVAAGAAAAASLLACGTVLHAAMHLPYGLQLSYGWTALTMTANGIFAVLMPVLVYLLAIQFGITGAAGVWVLINVLYVTLVIPAMHRRLLKGEQAAWYRNDLVIPLAAAVAGAVVWRLILPAQASRIVALSIIAAAGATSLTVTALATPAPRQWLLARIQR